MKHLPTWSNLNKILSLCRKHRFCTVKRTDNEISGIKFGALGSQLKRNILNQWTSSVVSNSDVNIFPVESNKLQSSTLVPETSEQHNESMFEDILHHYVDTLPLIGENLPFGLALSKTVTGGGFRKNISEVMDDKTQSVATTKISYDSPTTFWNPSESTLLVVAFFCSPKKTTDWFHYWQRVRYTWWRKLSSVSSCFSISNIAQSAHGDQLVTLQYEFPWGRNMLERVSASPCLKLDVLHETVSQDELGDRSKSVSPSVITCEADLDLAVIAYLSDAYEERQWAGSLRPVLRLHHMLAPYKVSIVINGSSAETIKKLRDLATYQVKELKKNAVSILPNPELASEVPLDMQFRRFDEMGVPYTIVLSDHSLICGIAGLRNRDTTLQEQVHVTELTSKLLLYLQMKSKIS